MSIKNELYSLCKELQKINLREEIRNLIIDLSRCTDKTMWTEKDRSAFGSLAEQQSAQFMGYLIVDKKRDEIEKSGLLKVPPINDYERELLKKAHFIINYLCKKCISKIISRIPNLTNTLNPYFQFSYPNYSLNIHDLIDIQVFKNIEDQFNDSMPVKNIYNLPSDLSIKIDSEKYLGLVIGFTNRINNCGVHDSPKDFNDLYLRYTPGSQEYNALKLLFSVLCVREILKIMNQLLYQAFLNNKLPLLDQDNIINISKQNSHSVGEGITLLNQPNGDEIFSNPGDLILLKVQLNTYKLDTLCFIDEKTLSFSKDFGDTQEFYLRVVDDDLNPFMNLLKSLR